ncbi:MAG: tetratricopeptide repeat protein, partial [Alteraurantiacibacter sp.]
MHKRYPIHAFGLTTAMAAVILSGCATNSAPTANVSAAQATQAMANGQHSRAVQAAEAAVAADPRNATYRMVLGNAYLEAGRFGSAATSFEDAMALGENSPRAALSLALALTGQARYSEASALLRMWEGEIAASDLGLAFALAGEPDRGIHLLSNAIRGGDSSVKSRQNLAYAYAVAGRWREARMMAAQDVPAHEVGTRMAEWAQLSHSNAYQARIAGLLGVPGNVRDAGQPVH